MVRYSRWARHMLVRASVTVVVAAIVIALLLWMLPPRGKLAVLCSNNIESCRAVVNAYEKDSGHHIDLVRLPTSEALSRLRANADTPEFDVWLGGPAEAYVSAAEEGLLSYSGDLSNTDSIPLSLRDAQGMWVGVYGGILAFCVDESMSIEHPALTWDDLLMPRLRGRVVAPSPLLSGTAVTMLLVQYERKGDFRGVLEYLKELDAQLVTYTDSGITPARLVASGKADVAITFAPYCQAERDAGAPVEVIYPQDGTGYEIGAAAIVHGNDNEEIARDFMNFAISVPAQLLSSRRFGQLPTTSLIKDNLLSQLEVLEVPVLTEDVYSSASIRPQLIESWASKVRDGAY